MESLGAVIAAGEWSFFSRMCSTEEADFMAQLLGICPDHESAMNMVGPNEDSVVYSSDIYNMCSFLQGNSCGGDSTILFSTSSPESYYPYQPKPILLTNNCFMEMNYGTEEGNGFLNQELSVGSMKDSDGDIPLAALDKGQNLHNEEEPEIPEPKPSTEDKFNSLSPNSNKRSRNSGDVQKGKRNKSRKNQKLVTANNNDEEDNDVIRRQSSSSYCSEDDSKACQELKEGGTSTSSLKDGKTRASKASATDSQSLYARKRRERINERLRTLQNLVPNGRKVDISTMLEEAVEYVKFLQLQIKLLSSDDLWMYAPIAYNGMDIGLDLNITSPR